MVFFALMLILKKSSLGLHVRAVAQNRDMARALSIKSDWVDAITFGLGSGIAGVAGMMQADGIHPTEPAQMIMLKWVYEGIKK